tara:strand:- start:1563 stop:2174 length:612 start_codon:yes stop_codon:yes gene_type:complete
MPATNRKSYKDYLSRSSKAKVELEDLQHEIYDRPMPVEMQQQYALVAFINSESIRAASMACGVPSSQIRKWSSEFGWDAIKKDHYEKVSMRTQEILDNDEVDRKSIVLNKLMNTLEKTIEMTVDDIDITEVERAKAVKDMVDAYVKLSGGGSETKEKELIPGVSPQTQQLFISQFNTTVDNNEDSDLIDVNYEDILGELVESE